MHTARRKKCSFTGNSAPNLKSFFGDVFSQDKASKPPLYMHTARRKKRSIRETQPKTSNHFSVMFFRKTRKISDGVPSVLRAKFDAVFGKAGPNLSSFFGDVFSQNKASKPPLYMHTARRKKRSFTKLSPKPQIIFRRCFFRKTRKMSDGVLSVLRAKFDTVLRKNSPKNQISIMSASFFFAISSISLTYLSVIF